MTAALLSAACTSALGVDFVGLSWSNTLRCPGGTEVWSASGVAGAVNAEMLEHCDWYGCGTV
ncbi:hypothetical protein, partial [Streptomyces brasiliscabiei]|uniref:hypothetical protein n=1 Tax=Streptomyces brasiliscabiei TaxID=2736302 RepID=UPI003014ADFE